MGGRLWLKDTIADKIILARAIVQNPELLVLNESQLVFNQDERLELIKRFIDPAHHWTLIVVSKDPEIMQMFDRILIFEDGKIIYDGNYAGLKENIHFDVKQL